MTGDPPASIPRVADASDVQSFGASPPGYAERRSDDRGLKARAA
jgi:hypothetical protein